MGVVLAGAVSCADATAPDRELVLETKVFPVVFRPGDSVTVHVVVSNVGRHPWTIQLNTCPNEFTVADSTGRQVGPGPRLCAAWSFERTLNPGDTTSYDYAWFGYVWDVNGRAGSSALPPGLYSLRGQAMALGSDTPIASDPVKFLVVR